MAKTKNLELMLAVSHSTEESLDRALDLLEGANTPPNRQEEGYGWYLTPEVMRMLAQRRTIQGQLLQKNKALREAIDDQLDSFAQKVSGS